MRMNELNKESGEVEEREVKKGSSLLLRLFLLLLPPSFSFLLDPPSFILFSSRSSLLYSLSYSPHPPQLSFHPAIIESKEGKMLCGGLDK